MDSPKVNNFSPMWLLISSLCTADSWKTVISAVGNDSDYVFQRGHPIAKRSGLSERSMMIWKKFLSKFALIGVCVRPMTFERDLWHKNKNLKWQSTLHGLWPNMDSSLLSFSLGSLWSTLPLLSTVSLSSNFCRPLLVTHWLFKVPRFHLLFK